MKAHSLKTQITRLLDYQTVEELEQILFEMKNRSAEPERKRIRHDISRFVPEVFAEDHDLLNANSYARPY